MPSTEKSRHSLSCVDWLAIGLLLLVGFSLRMPFLGESLWVDELHSAWVVADSFAVIPQRAEMGNQTPLYYWGLWFWRQVFGLSEWSLRFPSLLASLGSVALLYFMVKHSSNCRTTAILASAMLACESNSIFFGTETRPYALIMLGSLFVVHLLDLASAKDWRTRLLICLATMLTCLLHLSTLLTATIGATSWWVWQRRNSSHQLDRARWVFAGIGMASLLSLGTIWEVWQRRQIWDSLQPRSLGDILILFPWIPMLVLPGVTQLSSSATLSSSARMDTERLAVPLCLFVLAPALTGFALAYGCGVGMWHRKYLISILPFLCWCSAILWIRATTRVLFLTRLSCMPLSVREGVRWGILVVLLYYLTVPSGSLVNGVLRGEDWRGAIALIDRKRSAGDSVRVAPSLYESRTIEGTWNGAKKLPPDRWTYFSFPTSSLYLVKNARPLGEVFASSWRVESADLREEGEWIEGLKGSSLWILARSTASNLKRWYEARLVPAIRTSDLFSTAVNSAGVELHDFGGVSVLRVPYADGN